MPELPAHLSSEVERAASLAKQVALGKVISRVDTTEDTIVYSGITHLEFANKISGRKVVDVGRYGKVFYFLLDGEGPHPVLHLGMTGMIQVQGQEPAVYYRQKPGETGLWPPKFMKFILHLDHSTASQKTLEPVAQLAFLDARRLGRIRLCKSPLTEPPISMLGFDPLLSMPSLEDFTESVRRRSCVIKVLLLDQSFSAGVGNWIADEVLYQSRIHPEQRANEMSELQLAALYANISSICRKAVEVNADPSLFPEDWLFRHRWGKGKKSSGESLLLPNGRPASIKWIKVGGRTSAFVPELQILHKTDGLPENKTPIPPGDKTTLPSHQESHLKRKPPISPNSSPRKLRSLRKYTLRNSELVEEGT